jgi:hypothetical protein
MRGFKAGLTVAPVAATKKPPATGPVVDLKYPSSALMADAEY